MTWRLWLNWYVLRWFGVRIARQVKPFEEVPGAWDESKITNLQHELWFGIPPSHGWSHSPPEKQKMKPIFKLVYVTRAGREQ